MIFAVTLALAKVLPVAVVRDFVVTGYSGGESRVTWSAINDETSWTAGSNQSDFQVIPDQGHVKAVVGGEYGIIFMNQLQSF